MTRLSATGSALDTDARIQGNNVPFAPVGTSGNTNAHSTTDDSTGDIHPLGPDSTLAPGGSRDLSFIGLQAFALGVVGGGGVCLTALLLSLQSPWWRLPGFFTCLAIFHFLEYWTTAAYNVATVKASSFLLFNNGRAYTIAHTMASVEVGLANAFPQYQRWGVGSGTIATGAVLVVVGQVARSIAMKQAGTNFNHAVQTKRHESHILVTTGLYAHLRHPSYFGFFWWALGTQLLVGNKVCLAGYAIVLWRFFAHRIQMEEAHLSLFFGEEYGAYRKRTGTKIPFIP